MDRTIDMDHWSPVVLGRSKGVLSMGDLWVDEDNSLIYWVRGSENPQTKEKPVYRTQVLTDFEGDFIITCSCPNGMSKAQPTCYHTGAVALYINRIIDAGEQDD